jgi:hypothetical protein
LHCKSVGEMPLAPTPRNVIGRNFSFFAFVLRGAIRGNQLSDENKPPSCAIVNSNLL